MPAVDDKAKPRRGGIADRLGHLLSDPIVNFINNARKASEAPEAPEAPDKEEVDRVSKALIGDKVPDDGKPAEGKPFDFEGKPFNFDEAGADDTPEMVRARKEMDAQTLKQRLALEEAEKRQMEDFDLLHKLQDQLDKAKSEVVRADLAKEIQTLNDRGIVWDENKPIEPDAAIRKAYYDLEVARREALDSSKVTLPDGYHAEPLESHAMVEVEGKVQAKALMESVKGAYQAEGRTLAPEYTASEEGKFTKVGDRYYVELPVVEGKPTLDHAAMRTMAADTVDSVVEPEVSRANALNRQNRDTRRYYELERELNNPKGQLSDEMKLEMKAEQAELRQGGYVAKINIATGIMTPGEKTQERLARENPVDLKPEQKAYNDALAEWYKDENTLEFKKFGLAGLDKDSKDPEIIKKRAALTADIEAIEARGYVATVDPKTGMRVEGAKMTEAGNNWRVFNGEEPIVKKPYTKAFNADIDHPAGTPEYDAAEALKAGTEKERAARDAAIKQEQAQYIELADLHDKKDALENDLKKAKEGSAQHEKIKADLAEAEGKIEGLRKEGVYYDSNNNPAKTPSVAVQEAENNLRNAERKMAVPEGTVPTEGKVVLPEGYHIAPELPVQRPSPEPLPDVTPTDTPNEAGKPASGAQDPVTGKQSTTTPPPETPAKKSSANAPDKPVAGDGKPSAPSAPEGGKGEAPAGSPAAPEESTSSPGGEVRMSKAMGFQMAGDSLFEMAKDAKEGKTTGFSVARNTIHTILGGAMLAEVEIKDPVFGGILVGTEGALTGLEKGMDKYAQTGDMGAAVQEGFKDGGLAAGKAGVGFATNLIVLNAASAGVTYVTGAALAGASAETLAATGAFLGVAAGEATAGAVAAAAGAVVMPVAIAVGATVLAYKVSDTFIAPAVTEALYKDVTKQIENGGATTDVKSKGENGQLLVDATHNKELFDIINKNPEEAKQLSSNPELAAKGITNAQDPAYMQKKIDEAKKEAENGGAWGWIKDQAGMNPEKIAALDRIQTAQAQQAAYERAAAKAEAEKAAQEAERVKALAAQHVEKHGKVDGVSGGDHFDHNTRSGPNANQAVVNTQQRQVK